VGAGYDFRAYLEAVRQDLRQEGYDADLARVSDQKAVHSAFVRFPGLLHEMGLSGHREEAFSVKSVDAPPRGSAGDTFAGTFCCIYSITTAPRSWPESCTLSCSGPIPRVVTSTTSSGT
jgi:hypothetical protein